MFNNCAFEQHTHAYMCIMYMYRVSWRSDPDSSCGSFCGCTSRSPFHSCNLDPPSSVAWNSRDNHQIRNTGHISSILSGARHHLFVLVQFVIAPLRSLVRQLRQTEVPVLLYGECVCVRGLLSHLYWLSPWMREIVIRVKVKGMHRQQTFVLPHLIKGKMRVKVVLLHGR